MAKVTVYTPKGVAVEMESVDAREVCEHCGYSMEPKKIRTKSKNNSANVDTDKSNKID